MDKAKNVVLLDLLESSYIIVTKEAFAVNWLILGKPEYRSGLLLRLRYSAGSLALSGRFGFSLWHTLLQVLWEHLSLASHNC